MHSCVIVCTCLPCCRVLSLPASLQVPVKLRSSKLLAAFASEWYPKASVDRGALRLELPSEVRVHRGLRVLKDEVRRAGCCAFGWKWRACVGTVGRGGGGGGHEKGRVCLGQSVPAPKPTVVLWTLHHR